MGYLNDGQGVLIIGDLPLSNQALHLQLHCIRRRGRGEGYLRKAIRAGVNMIGR